jgi:Flp pilus assembly pilin Flp
MRFVLIRFTACERGSAVVEYGVIMAGTTLALLFAVLSFTEELQRIYESILAGLALISGF